MVSSTKNTKNNRKIVVQRVYINQYYKIPDNVNLKDKRVVKDWFIEDERLHIHYVSKKKEDAVIECEYEEDEFVMNDIVDAIEGNIDYSEDESENENEY